MAERIRMVLLVSFVAATVWLFAEAESLTDVDVRASATLVAANPALRVETDAGWDGRVRVTLRGSAAGITQARDFLELGVQLPLPLAGAASDAPTEVDLLATMQSLPAIQRFGVSVVAVVPLRVSVRVREMVDVELPIRPELPAIDTGGTARVSPPTLRARVPRELRERLAANNAWPPAVTATLPAQDLASIPRGAMVERQAELVIPTELASTGIEIDPTAQATINFTIRARSESLELRVPVQVLTPPIESGQWVIDIAGGDLFVDLTATAPPELIARLRERTDRLVGVLALSSDDLANNINEKTVGFALLRDNAFAPIPEALRISTTKRSVAFTARPASTQDPTTTPSPNPQPNDSLTPNEPQP